MTKIEMESFFIPDLKFVEWIGHLANRRMIADVGCGKGLLIQKLFNAGFKKVLGIDAFEDHFKWSERFYEATGEFGASKMLPHRINSPIFETIFKELKPLVLLCRPCHHPWLIEETYNLCFKTKTELLYIGLEENLEIDLYNFDYQQLQHEGTSADNEIVLKLL